MKGIRDLIDIVLGMSRRVRAVGRKKGNKIGKEDLLHRHRMSVDLKMRGV